MYVSLYMYTTCQILYISPDRTDRLWPPNCHCQGRDSGLGEFTSRRAWPVQWFYLCFFRSCLSQRVPTLDFDFIKSSLNRDLDYPHLAVGRKASVSCRRESHNWELLLLLTLENHLAADVTLCPCLRAHCPSCGSSWTVFTQTHVCIGL